MHARGYKVTGVDSAEGTILKAKQMRPYLNLQVGDLKNLKFSDKTFTHSICLGVIEHFLDKNKISSIIKNIKRVTSNIIFLSVQHYTNALKKRIIRESLDKANVKLNFFQFFFSEKEFIGLLKKYDLKPLKFKYYSTVIGLKRNHCFFRFLY